MAVSHVLTHTFAQEIANDSSLTIAPSGTVPAGDLLVLAILMQAARSVTSVTDTQGNTWTEHCDTVNGTIETLSIWTCPVATQLTTGDTISIAFGSSTAAKTALLEQFTGTPTGTWVDEGMVTASGSSTTPSVTAGGATSFADSMLFGVCAYDGTGPAFTPSASPLSFTELEDVNQTNGGTRRNIASFWDLPGSTVTATYEGTLSTSRNWIMAGLAFLAAASGAEYTDDITAAATASPTLSPENFQHVETILASGSAAPTLSAEGFDAVSTLLATSSATPTLSSELRIDVDTLQVDAAGTVSLSPENFEHVETILTTSAATPTLSAENFEHAETILASIAATVTLSSETFGASDDIETVQADLSVTAILAADPFEAVSTLLIAANAPPSLSSELRIDVERLDASAAATLSLSSQAFEHVETLQASASATVTLSSEVFEAEILDDLTAAVTCTVSLTTETFTQSDVETVTLTVAATLSLPTETFQQGSTVIEDLTLAVTATPSLSSIKRLSTLTTPRVSLNRVTTTADIKYVSYLDIPEDSEVRLLAVNIDGLGSGLGPSQDYRGVIYDNRDSLVSPSGEPDNRVAVSVNTETVLTGETDAVRYFTFAPTVLAAGRYWFGVHAGPTASTGRIKQESQIVHGRWTRSDPFADGTNANFDPTTAVSSNRMYVATEYEVDETYFYADGEASVVALNVSSRQTTPNPPLTASSSGTGSLLGELIETVETLELSGNATLTLSAEVGTFVDDLTAAATATPSLPDETVTGGSGVDVETLSVVPSSVLQLVTEVTETHFGSEENGGAQVLALRKDVVYGGVYTATRSGRVNELELWVDGLGSAATGTAQLRGLIYSYQAGFGPTTLRARGATIITVDKGAAASRVSLPTTGFDVVEGTSYVLAVQVGGTDNVARISGSSLAAGTAYGADLFSDGPDSTFPTTVVSGGSGSIEIFGYAEGNLAGASDADAVLNALVALGCTAIRTDLSWNSDDTTYDTTKYDGFAVKCANRGLEFIPCIHPKNPNANDYKLPNNIVTNGTDVIDKFQARYGRGGTFITAYNTEKAKTTPGAIGGVTVSKTGNVKPVSRYEIWNEPQTGTGDCSPSSSSLQTNATAAASFVAFFKAAAASIKAHPTFDAAQGDLVLGPALGGIDIDYANVMYSIDNDCFLDVDVITAHCYMSQNPNTSPGNTTAPLKTGLPTSISQYNASGGQKYSDPEQKRIRTFQTLKDWANSHTKTAHLMVGMTEGGYSGSNQSPVPPNVVTEANQATWTGNVIDWAQTKSFFYCFIPYNPIDYNSVTYTGTGTQYQYNYWYENLGMRTPSAMKPAGTTYASKIAAGGGGSSETITTQNVKLPIYAVVTTTDIGGATITDTLTAAATCDPSLSSEAVVAASTFTETLIVSGSATVTLSGETLNPTTLEDLALTVAATVSLSDETNDWGDLVTLALTGVLTLSSEEGDHLDTLIIPAQATASLPTEASTVVDFLELDARAVLEIASEGTPIPIAPDVEVLVNCYNETVIVTCETGEVVVPFTVDERIVEF